MHLFKDSGKFIEAPVDRLKNLMHKQNHSAVDLVKIEIEGAGGYRDRHDLSEDETRHQNNFSRV